MKETPKVCKIALPVQDVAHSLIRNLMTRVSQRAGNAIVTQVKFSRAKRTTSSSTLLKSKVGQDRYVSRLATLNIGSQPSIDTATPRYEFAKTRHRDMKLLDDASATGVPATNVDNDTNWRTYRRRVCYPWGTMSALNGDKARFNRERKRKLARREYSQALRKKLKGHTPPRATGTQL